MEIRKGYLDTSDGQVHYRSCGRGDGTPIVFLHMVASSSQCYEKVMGSLCNEYRMIALDTPGFGESFLPPVVPTIPYYATTLLEALSNIGISSFHVFGHHTGAAIAAEMAGIAPERVASLMMKGPIWLTEKEARSFEEQFSKPVFIEEDGRHCVHLWDYVASLDPDHPRELCHREAIDTLKAIYSFPKAFSAVFNQDYERVFSRIACPMLLLCGENDVLRPYFQRICDAFPEAMAAVLPACGVYGLDNCADLVAKRIRVFLQGLDQGS